MCRGSRAFVESDSAALVDLTAKRYSKLPSELIGITSKYYAFQLDLAMAVRYDYEDKDFVEYQTYQITTLLRLVAKSLGVQFKGKEPEFIKRIDQINKAKEDKKPKGIPLVTDLLAMWRPSS